MGNDMKHFRMINDLETRRRWFLTGPETARAGESTVRSLLDGEILSDVRALSSKVFERGSILDITFSAFSVPIITQRAREVFATHLSADTQTFDLTVEGRTEKFYALNITKSIKCISDEHSKFDRWSEADGLPDRVGQYRNMVNIVAQRDALGAAGIFRVDGWKFTIMVPEKAKAAIENAKLTGVRFG